MIHVPKEGKMRRALTVLTALGFVVALPATAFAGEKTNHSEGVHVGLGASLDTTVPIINNNPDVYFFGGPFGGGALQIPIDIAGVVRVEPQIGFVATSNSDESDTSKSTSSFSAVRVGLGAFFMFDFDDSAAAYVGAKLGPIFASNSSESHDKPADTTTTTTSSVTHFAIGPAIGADYYFSKHFSLGAEVGINFTVLGNVTSETEQEPPPDPPIDNEDTEEEGGLTVNASTMLTARFFFM